LRLVSFRSNRSASNEESSLRHRLSRNSTSSSSESFAASSEGGAYQLWSITDGLQAQHGCSILVSGVD
jgi:hypothetical protein